MGALNLSYPVTENARQVVAKYPAIQSGFRLPNSGRSPYEIVRLLSNTHERHIERQLEFINKWLWLSEPIGGSILRIKHPFQLEQSMAELAMFAHLYERLGAAVRAIESGGKPTCPDIEVQSDSGLVRIEVYTPVDLMGFHLFDHYVPMVLRYLDVVSGYDIRVETCPVQKMSGYDQESLFYPYTVPDEIETHQWLAQFSKEALEWLAKPQPNSELRMLGPGGKIEVLAKLAQQFETSGNRLVTVRSATRSTDTTLFFDVGTASDTAQSSWGRKLRKKLRKEQCGPIADGILRILVVNFVMADTGWPHFISEARFTSRFAETIRILVGANQPYDVVLPAQLRFRCCFGRPAWISQQWRKRGTRFIEASALDVMCQPPPDPTPDEIEELLGSDNSGEPKEEE